jgi:hypothetical protein
MRFTLVASKAVLVVLLAAAICVSAADTPTVTVKGYVLDSACAFTKGLSKPISKQCATSCANAGSQLVILADDGTIYWPIADTTPSTGQNPKLLPFAGAKVTASGKLYQRGGSKAIVIEKIEAQASQKSFSELLRHSLATTNPIESCLSTVEHVARSVERWRDSDSPPPLALATMLSLRQPFSPATFWRGELCVSILESR